MKATFKIFRYDPDKDKKPYYKEYTLDVEPNTVLLDVLNDIKWHYDGTLTFRRSCAHAICGSCGMTINGKNRLACQTLIKDLDTSKPIKIEPLKSYPVIKDLVVDMNKFYEKMFKVKPYLVNDNPPPGREFLQTPEEQKLIDEAYSCIWCGCCTSSCPSFWADDDYLGPAALLKAYRFIFDTRDTLTEERLRIVNDADGVWRCHVIFNCVEACPKEINITEYISRLKLKVVTSKL